MKWITIVSLALLVGVGSTGCASRRGGGAPTPQTGEHEKLVAPLFDNLGTYERPITTSSPLAQRYFNQGMRLLYAFNHGEAIRSFEAVAAHSPGSAMAYWGVALAYGPNINRPMPPEDAPKAYEALRRAVELSGGVSEEERAYIQALTARYSPDPIADRRPLDRAYADAMRELMRRYPGDLDAATLFAEAVMDTTPWSYWSKDQAPKPEMVEAFRALESVLARAPNHPGANHYYIHLMEAGPTPEKALPSADRLRTLVPGAGHLVHMPAHIYVRVGLYGEAAFANERALEADERYLAETRAQGFYPAMYYPHNMHFLWYATSMEGRREEAIRAARRVIGMAHGGATEAERFWHLPLLVMVRFGEWGGILNEPPPPSRTPLASALYHFARGLALTVERRLNQAEVEQSRLHAIAGTKALLAQDSPGLPASSLVALADNLLRGQVSLGRGWTETGIRDLTEAVRLEDELPYMEPPYWFPPVRHWLGAALLDVGRPAEAEAVYRRDLSKNRENGWSLFGLAQSLRAQGKEAEAREVDERFRTAWLRADITLKSSRF